MLYILDLLKAVFKNPIILITIISITLVGIWFREGNIMATGESGIPFYNPLLQFNINKDAWAQYTLGHPINIGIAAKPTYWFLAVLQSFMIPNFLIQAFFLWVMLISSGLSIYFLSKELFPKLDQKTYLLSPLFYWFNPFSLVNVWNRFLNNFIVFYTLLPLILFLFIKGVKTKQYKYVILIGLVSVIFSYALTSIAFNMLLWFVLVYTTLFYAILSKEGNNFFAIKFFVLTLVFWILANFWWIGQVFSYIESGSFAMVVSSSFIANDNYYTFNILSERLGNLIDLLRFKHASFFADTEHINWVGMYQFPIIIFFEFLVAGIFLIPIIIKRKQKEVLFLGGLFLLSIFFAKGNTPPFGEIFGKAFINVPFLQVFRNPFEKIGFILPLSAAPLFCLGVSMLMEKFITKWKLIIYLFLILWLLVIWGGPFWSGFVFTSTDSPTNKIDVGYQVSAPKFYKEAADWLLSQGKNFRLVVFPIGGEGITNMWSKGYSGVELTNQLLPMTSVSFNTNIPFYDHVSNNLERILLTRTDFPKIMDVLNSKFIMIRSDINWKIRNMRDPQTISKRVGILEPSSGKLKQFGDLSFWEYSNWKDKTIYPAKNLIQVSGSSRIEDVLQLDYEDVLYYGNKPLIKGLAKSEIVHPTYKFELGRESATSDFSFTNDLIFPTVRIIPSDKLYPMIRFKEKIEQILVRDREILLVKKISLLGKRLMEAQKESEKNNLEGFKIALQSYIKNLKEVVPRFSESGVRINDKSISQDELYSVFKKHDELINNFKTFFPDEKTIETARLILKELLIERGILPYFGFIEKQNYPIRHRIIYQFPIAHLGKYELLLDAKSWDKYFKISLNEPLQLQIDKELVFKKAFPKGDYVSFGFFDFDQGNHEVAWNTPDEINLVDTPSELKFRAEHGVTEKSFPIHSFDPYSRYILSFDYLINKGSGVETSIEQNNEKYKNSKIEPQFLANAGPDSYNFGLKHFSKLFIPSAGADSAKLVFKVEAWNNCKEAYKFLGVDRCRDEVLRQRFDLPTENSITNITLVKLMTEVPFLVKERDKDSVFTLPLVSYNKVTGAEYTVKIENAKNPFILVLNQLFDPGWKVYVNSNKEIGEMHFLANSYANGWLINKTGTYSLTIKFMPQEMLQKGEKISLFTVVVGAIFLGWRFFLRK